MEWISVNDKLPDRNQKVLVYGNPTICCDEDMQEKQICIATYEIKESEWKVDKDNKKYDVMYSDIFRVDEMFWIINPSHWMPCPEPPNN